MLNRVLGCLLGVVSLSMGQATIQTFPGSVQSVPNPNAKRYPVTGTVVNSMTGAPIARALVQLQGPEPARAFTGEDGHFEIKDVPEGRYSLVAQRPGFQFDPKGNPQITVGATTPTVECKLIPQSALRGRIVNSDGEPVENVGVQVLRRNVMNGRRDWQMAGAVRSDETGEFAFENLSPGSYLVHTEPYQVFAYANEVVVDGRHYPDLYLPQYFPNAPDRISAQAVQLQPGVDSEADFTLSAVPGYKASGTVEDVRHYGASCEDADGEVVSSAFFVEHRTGKFTLSRLPAGSCTLVAQTGFGPANAEALYGELLINIKDGDVNGLRLSLTKLPDIEVHITGAAKDADNPGVNLQLLPHATHARRGGHQVYGPDKRNDVLAFHSVLPGVYSLSSFPFGNACLASVTSGSTDLLRTDLTVLAGSVPPPISVTLRTDCATVTGKLPDGVSPAGVAVIAVPEGAPAMAKVGFANNGSFQIANLAPGDYTLYAFTDFQNAPFAEPEFLKTVTGQKITIAANDKPTVQMNKVNDTSGAQ